MLFATALSLFVAIATASGITSHDCTLEGGLVNLWKIPDSSFQATGQPGPDTESYYMNPCAHVSDIQCGMGGTDYLVSYAMSPGYSGCQTLYSFNRTWRLMKDPYGYDNQHPVAQAQFVSNSDDSATSTYVTVTIGCYNGSGTGAALGCLNASGPTGGCSFRSYTQYPTTFREMRLQSDVMCNAPFPTEVPPPPAPPLTTPSPSAERKFITLRAYAGAASSSLSGNCTNASSLIEADRRPAGACVPQYGEKKGASSELWECVAGGTVLTITGWNTSSSCQGAPSGASALPAGQCTDRKATSRASMTSYEVQC